MRIAVFITVRIGSSRLPAKAMLEIKGKPIIEHLIDWIKRAENIDEIVLCTTTNKEDDILIEIAKRNDIKWFRGSETDIIKRHLGAVEKYDIDFVINAECDAIFYEAKYIDTIAEIARKDPFYDVISTTELPNGVNIYGYKRESLQEVLTKSVETGWLELLYTEKRLNQGYVSIEEKYKTRARLTLDYPEDYEFFKVIYDEFDGYFTLEDIVKKLKEKPELIDINIGVDENYWNNFARKKLRVLVIGLGSMGKRRIRNLKKLGLKNIIGYDTNEERRKEVDVKTVSNFDEAMKYEPNIFIISTPPDKHLPYQNYAQIFNISCFTEASVISKGLENLIVWENTKEWIAIPSCTMRFHPAIQKIKELIDTNKIGKPLTFTHHSGSFLPEWHPEDDPKIYYAYDKKQGAAKEIVPFELNWLTWIFGDVKSVKSYYKETMEWGIDDVYHILVEFESGVIGHLLVDVVSRKWTRKFECIGSEGYLEWNWNFDVIDIWKNDNDYKEYKYDISEAYTGYHPNITERMYIREMDYFLDVVIGKRKPIYTLQDDLNLLKLLEKIEENGSVDES